MTNTPEETLRYPAAFGHWCIRGDRLEARLPRRAVTVRAPQRLLAQVAQVCDGQTPWANVVSKLGSKWEATTIRQFLADLVSNGLLVEAGMLWAHWGEVAQLPMSSPRVATSSHEIAGLVQVAAQRLAKGEGRWPGEVARRDQHLSRLLAGRFSARTFDDVPITEEDLLAILWAAHGVIRSNDDVWHRTVASGGNMHSARWFVAVLRDLPAEGVQATARRGLYEARFHQQGGASLHKFSAALDEAWDTLVDPRVLQYASAAIYPIYELTTPAKKYGNRAALFAVLECGQSLQNAQLMAESLGCAGMVRGDAKSAAIEELFRDPHSEPSAHWMSLPCLVVGARPTIVQIQSQQRSEGWLSMRPNYRLTQRLGGGVGAESGRSFAFAAHFSPDDQGDPVWGSGRSSCPQAAIIKAEAEAWERLAWLSPSNLKQARQTDLAGAIEPSRLVSYSERQHSSRGFAHARFSNRRQYLWRRASSHISGQKHWVPADCVHAWSSLPARFRRRSLTNASTSGVAAHVSTEQALQSAALELIERDAFCAAWINRSSAPAQVVQASLPHPLRERVTRLISAGFSVDVLLLEKSIVRTIAVVVRREAPPFSAITASCALDLEAAVAKALDEAEGRAAYAIAVPLPTSKPSAPDVVSINAINDYCRLAANQRQADFLLRGRSLRYEDLCREGRLTWTNLLDRLRERQLELLSVDLTPAGAAIQQGRTPIHVVRAFIPGLLPMWFEYGTQPEGLARFQALRARGPRQGEFHHDDFIHPFT